MKKCLTLLLFSFLTLSCKMKINTSLPNLFAGKWQHYIDKNNSDTILYLTVDGQSKICDYTFIPMMTTERFYVYEYSAFHITDASGTITFDDGENVQFVLIATPKEGRKTLSLTSGDGVTRIYTYDGQAVL